MILVPFVPQLITLIKFNRSRIIKLYKEIKKLPKTSTKSSNQIDLQIQIINLQFLFQLASEEEFRSNIIMTLYTSAVPFLPILHSI